MTKEIEDKTVFDWNYVIGQVDLRHDKRKEGRTILNGTSCFRHDRMKRF